MLPPSSINKTRRVFLLASAVFFVLISSVFTASAQMDDPLAPALESARRKRDSVQLESLKSQLEQRISQNPKDALSQYKLALVENYLVDVAESRKDSGRDDLRGGQVEWRNPDNLRCAFFRAGLRHLDCLTPKAATGCLDPVQPRR
jgi:hypothetical protein